MTLSKEGFPVAQVVSVNISERKGTVKREVPEIQLRRRHGIVGDAHAGDWHRQISLLAEESVDKMRALLPDLQPGAFAENINTRGLELKSLPVGTRLRLGEAAVEITQIGKECHSDCEIKRLTGKCVMPTEGVFAVVVREGTVRKGDEIEIIKDSI
jgi:MOSC domain-containing protein YiiM